MISYLFKPRDRVLKSINLNPQMKILKLENDSPSNLDSRKYIKTRCISSVFSLLLQAPIKVIVSLSE